jgi:hypothetical protein
LTLEARAFNDGDRRFASVCPATANSACPMKLPVSHSRQGSTVWYHDFEGHYEGAHARKRLRGESG